MKEITFDTPFETYVAKSVLGNGGAGTAYLVLDSVGAEFALKRLNPRLITRDRLGRFKNELAFCQRNTHANIVTVVDSGYVDDGGVKCPFYVMRKYDKTLRKLLEEGIEPGTVLSYFAKILDGVEAAHLKEVWHRDLKPENILIGASDSTLVIADFGVAHFSQDELETHVETKPSSRLANFQYAAPEQRVKGRPVDQRADIYALGLLLNEMFTGDVPHGAAPKTVASVSEDHAYLDSVVDKMIRQNPNERYQSIDEIKKDLSAARNEHIARQRLSESKDEVVPRYSIDDPLVEKPIQIASFDIDGHTLVLTLTDEPNDLWKESLKNIGNYRLMPGVCEPGLFKFHGKTTRVGFHSDSSAHQILEMFKDYVAKANTEYRNQLHRRAQQKQQREEQELKARSEAEEQRARLLGSLRL